MAECKNSYLFIALEPRVQIQNILNSSEMSSDVFSQGANIQNMLQKMICLLVELNGKFCLILLNMLSESILWVAGFSSITFVRNKQ